jgi:RNA polymerase sigma factor (sigma-70 family)
MGKSASTDPELLAQWLERRREEAFHILVDRYAGLVLMSARRTCGDDSMAAEASQLTFILLARKAPALLACSSLGGWLHRAALMHSKNLLRSARREDRKRQILHAAMERTPSPAAPAPSWSELQPLLDEALAALPGKDREALLLRFYRSLGVREIGLTLGISTDAAQKRIDRATIRLRDRLARRGCQAGTALGAVMLAGFAADVQAATPAVSMLATKALAATAASGATAAGSSTFITALSMKATSYVLPATLLLAVAWVTSQLLSMAKLEEENAMLSSKIDGWELPASAATRRFPLKTALDKRPVDWREVARELNEDDGSGGKAYLTSKLRLHEGFLSMSRGELLVALDEVDAINLGGWQQKTLLTCLYRSLLQKDPEAAMNHAIEHFSSDPWQPNAEILGFWAAKDLKGGTAWLDARIAAGTLEERSLAKRLDVRIAFERELVSSLISSDGEEARRRVATLPEDVRIELFMREDVFPRGWILKVKPEDGAAFARLVREHVPDQRLWILSHAINGRQSPTDPAQMHDYLQGIEATADERKACIMDMLEPRDGPFLNRPLEPGEDGTRKVSSSDFDELRAWVGKEAPELVEAATGKALAGLGGTVKYEDLVELALHFHATSGRDEVILPLLYQPRDYRLARSLAAKLSDAAKREEILKNLDSSEVK